jgi:hypothetical protein
MSDHLLQRQLLCDLSDPPSHSGAASGGSGRPGGGGQSSKSRVLDPVAREVRFPRAEVSSARLLRSGWHLRVMVFTDSSGRTVWEISGDLGEHQIKVEGATRDEVWHKATLAAASCGS